MVNKLFGISKNKIGAIAIATFLILSMSASLLLIPNAKAATGPNVPTYAYIAVSTNPVGHGQSVEVIMWLNIVLPGAEPGNPIRFSNYKLTITEPDGTNTSQTFATVEDPTSAQDYAFTPSTTGNYMLTFSFPGLTFTWTGYPGLFGGTVNAYDGTYYEPSTASCSLTVQSATIPALPQTPLPTAYWTRPIYGENSAWYTVASNWLGDGAPGYTGFAGTYNAGGNGETLAGANDVVGSMTSHIMWTKQIGPGGIVGGNQTSIAGDSYFEGSAYCQRFENPIIVDGMLYYNPPLSFADGSTGNLTCVNLQTGATVWVGPQVQISFAYVYDVQDPNDHGVYPPILFTSGFAQAYDAFTGAFLFSETDVPSGTTILGPSGEMLILSLVNLAPTEITGYGPFGPIYTQLGPNQYYLQEWNSSRLWGDDYSGPSTVPPVVPFISTQGGIAANWAGGTVMENSMFGPAPTYIPSMYDFNVSVPYLNTAAGSPTVVGAIYNDLLLCYTGSLPSSGQFLFAGGQSTAPYQYVAISTAGLTSKSTTTTPQWHQTETAPAGNITVMEAGIDPVNMVFVENWRETQQYVGYSLTTGAHLWGPTVPQADLDYYGSPASGSLSNAFAYGKMYSSAYAGIVYCYDTKTGDILWTYGNGGEGNNTGSGVETPFAHYPTFIQAIGGDVVYLVTTEHTPESPLFKGGVASAINATTGKLIWSISDYTGEFETFSYAAADGYNTWFNGYDSSIYVVGQGPSKTTVTAPNSGLTYGQSVVISGTVTDISAGTTQAEQAADFPNGVPVCSDASMAQWMGYVYQQQPEPANFTGVPVTISVHDSNGNTRVIGTAMTNANGMYTLAWIPDIPGNFTVTATFCGNNGYYGSSDTTSFNVMQQAVTPPPTATPASNAATAAEVTIGFAAAIIVIVIAIAVVGLLLLRRRP
ncbi:MAG: PQQ-binding-like beta-propeller repeat protein [Candidatus Bathyarchaeia archaeon]|jgi:hypothetical protein